MSITVSCETTRLGAGATGLGASAEFSTPQHVAQTAIGALQQFAVLVVAVAGCQTMKNANKMAATVFN